MTAVAEAEITAVHAPGTDITPYAAPQIEEYRPRIIMQPEEARALDAQLRECMLAVLRDGVDYGIIPGAGDKKNLLKPGAEKLIQWFGFGFVNERDEIERDSDGNRIGVTYRCTVTKELGDGRKVVVATCEGYAGYDEDRYYTSAENARAKAEASERRWARQDDRAPKPEKWLNATEYKAPWNTVLKMAQKRALVGAAIDATAAAGLFTQDMEDVKTAAATASAGNASFTAAASDAAAALPEGVRNKVGSWYQGKGWPSPKQWVPEQWCAALLQAGEFLAEHNAAQKKPAGTQAATPLDPEDPWAAKVEGLASEDEARTVLWELAEAVDGGGMDGARADLIHAAVVARFPGSDKDQAAA